MRGANTLCNSDLITVEHGTGYLSFTPEWLAIAPAANVKAMFKLLQENEHRPGNAETVKRISEAMPTLGRYAKNAAEHKRVKSIQAAWAKYNRKNTPESKEDRKAALVINRLFKEKHLRNRPDYRSAWIDAPTGKMCATDGYRLYRFNRVISGVEVGKPLDPLNVAAAMGDMNGLEPLTPPTEADLKIRAALNRQCRENRPYDFGPGKPAAEVSCLRDLLQLFPAGKWYYNASPSPAGRRIYVIDAAGDALLLPVRKEADIAPGVYAPDPAPAEAEAAAELTPEQFEELAARDAMTPEEFAAALAA